jgi:hypothetical protein
MNQLDVVRRTNINAILLVPYRKTFYPKKQHLNCTAQKIVGLIVKS